MIRQYEPTIDYEYLKKEFNDYFDTKPFLTEYKKTEEFEKQIAKFIGTYYSVVVNNGTISLSLALLSQGIKAGDTVIVPAYSMIATANAVKFIGANPLFVDTDENGLLDLELVRKEIYEDEVQNPIKQIKGIIYVSINGRTYPKETLYSFYEECINKRIVFIEDAAQSFGSCYDDGGKIGDSPWITSFSFSMPKIITCGQGGCLVSNDKEITKVLRRIKDFGRDIGGNDVHDYYGINSKFTDLQAIVGLEQMREIDSKTQRKKEIYELYRKLLGKNVKFMSTDKHTIPWFVDIECKKRDELYSFLLRNNIQTRKVYPPMPYQKIYGEDKKYKNTTKISNNQLWLPCSLNLKDEDIKLICDKIIEFYIKDFSKRG